MKILPTLIITLLASSPLATTAIADEPIPRNPANVSVRNEVLTAIEKGLAYLQQQQIGDGSFANPDSPATSAIHPALSAMPLLAFHREPTGKSTTEYASVLKKGHAHLRSLVKPDGGIYVERLTNYNTSISLMALLDSGDTADEPILARARQFILGGQVGGLTSPELDGGFGYGSEPASTATAAPSTGGTPPSKPAVPHGRSDLDNTLVALEALRAYQNKHPQLEKSGGKQLNVQAAIDFITRCQNLPGQNKLDWPSDDAANKGGFIYHPGRSNAGELELPNGKKALRSYGTMSYAGLLSYVYADLKKDDPRIVATIDRLQSNYTIDDNPGLGRNGLYYYYYLLAKGLATARISELKTSDGKSVDWARELALKLISAQDGKGFWVNDTARWMEKDPVLVTSFSVLALEIVYGQL